MNIHFAGIRQPQSVRFGNAVDQYSGKTKIETAIRHLPRGSHRFVIGREADQDAFRVPTNLVSKSISRRHGEVWRDQSGKLWYQDIGSKGGTKLNGKPLKANTPTQIKSGDRLELAQALTLNI